MIASWFLAAGRVLKHVPATVWLALAAIAAVWVWGEYQYSSGVRAESKRWEQRLEEIEREARRADKDADRQRQTDNERNRDADDARKDAARNGGRHAANCERLRQAYPSRSFPACD